ncbi:25-hydroxyvitamin D-1 alpha hydroxylase, mitochondrial [Engraulis encrasicolus]|uniref:25-hydroxyvitamin D-1 alpha hydroxylase, mitochondrial n=1 Tax=Engraulis encrasicolus TaxID=184585 RepID=UPI002FD0BE3E
MRGWRVMLQQALKVSGRSASPLLKWVERCVEGTAVGTARQSDTHQLRTLAEMPGPTMFSFAWDLFGKRGLSRLHELQLEGYQRYGPMWKASFGPILTVHVAEPHLIEQVLRQEGQHPMRSDLSSWKDYRNLRGHGYGLLTAEGEEWQAVRSLLGKHTLRPKAVEAYDGTLNGVVTDLLRKLRLRRQQHPHGVVTDISTEFYRFGLEGISSVLFESRLGCLEPVVPEETERFIQSINTMFVMTLLTMAMPRWMHQLFPKPWDTFCQCWDYMFQFAKGHIDERLKTEAEKVARGEEIEGRYLTYFLSRTNMPMKSVYSNVTELLLAGVDTISGTLSWSLYELARHPDIQESLRAEVKAVMGDRLIPGAADVARMPFLKAVVKEVLRLYPVIPANARVVHRDIKVGDYLLPKNTLITLCQFATSRDPAQFPEPHSFVPQRWLNRDEGHHPYASLPFGVGKRSCIGRRIAELELYLAIARIVTQFEVRPDPEGGEVRPMTRTLLVPESEINLMFVER